MALGKITKTLVDGLPTGALVWDTGRSAVVGFGVRRQLRDAFYLLRYRFGGRQRFVTIGRHGSPWTPETARAEARRLLGLVVARIDPATERERKAETFGTEVQRYLERKRPAMKPRSFYEIERHLMLYAEPLHRLALSEIDRRTVAQRLGEIEEDNGPTARNRVRSSLSALFTWAIHEGLTEVNPVTGTAEASEGGPRERVVTAPELRAIWRALPAGDFGDIVRLLILTGQRRDEIGGLRWSEVDFDRGLIVLLPERTKNNRLHELPMAPQVRTILAQRPQSRDLIFGLGQRGFGGWSHCKGALDAKAGIAEWRLHDLRRTVATGMADKLGVLPHIVEAVLNHVSGHKSGVAGVYNRARYEGEMRRALERWAGYVEGLVR